MSKTPRAYARAAPHIDGANECEEALPVKGIVEERAVELGRYILAHKATVRRAAKQFGVSKSTVHKDVAQRLRTIDPPLCRQVKQI